MKLSLALGTHRSAVCRWLAPRATRGQAGDIPVPQIRRILAVAKAQGVALCEHDLLYGREVPDVAPIAV